VTAFNVAREALAPALARAAGIVPARAGIPIIQCVLLETSDEGLFVAATDTDVKYRERVDDVPRESWRGCVDAARLEAFVAGAPADGDVVLRADDEGRLSIRSGRASCRLPMPSAEGFPLFNRPTEGAAELTFDATAFAAGLRAVAPAMSSEQLDFICAARSCTPAASAPPMAIAWCCERSPWTRRRRPMSSCPARRCHGCWRCCAASTARFR
jgi:DNA polymerase-3 subunit beta